MDLLGERYRVVRRLGSGGMASVLLCEDEVLGRRVAVKRLHRTEETHDVRRFRREARVGARLNHPNLVTVFDTVSDDSGDLIVMEFVDGESLADALRRGPLEPERAIEVLSAVASALDHAHAAGVVHRDVKPANVLLGTDGSIKLADLGIAKSSHVTETVTGEMILGTLAYMPPERLRGEDTGPAGDVWSLAAVSFEALTGRRARAATTPSAAVAEGVSGRLPELREALPEAPAGAEQVLRRGLDPEPERRPASAGALVSELARSLGVGETEPLTEALVTNGAGEDATAPLAVPSPIAEPRADTVHRGRRRARMLAAGGLAAVAGVAIALAAGSGGGDDSPGGFNPLADTGPEQP
jgi:eukaryotic-like serine/threonine-protein kinase